MNSIHSLLGAGTHVYIGKKAAAGSLYRADKENKFGRDIYYYSKEKVSGINPYQNYIMNKKWSLSEEFSMHMIRYQQVGISIYTMKNRQFLTTLI